MENPLDDLHHIIDAAAGDPLTALAAVHRARVMLVWLEAAAVASARADGCTWAAMAAAAGVSKQAMHQRHAEALRGEAPPPPRPSERGR